eukprot:6084533-Amphidinium_carterae.1
MELEKQPQKAVNAALGQAHPQSLQDVGGAAQEPGPTGGAAGRSAWSRCCEGDLLRWRWQEEVMLSSGAGENLALG